MTAVATRWAVVALGLLLAVGVVYLLATSRTESTSRATDAETTDERAEAATADGSATTNPAAGQTVDGSASDGDDPPAVEGPSPVGLVAVQGPVDEASTYVSISWSHVDVGAHPDRSPRPAGFVVGYEIERDGSVVGSTAVDDQPWDDMAFREAATQGEAAIRSDTVTYRVRAVFDDGAGPWSEPVTVDLLTDNDIGSTFVVDDYTGSDVERAQQAVDDAEQAGGGIVLFDARTYEFDDPLLITGNGVLLRGAGTDQTTIRPTFAGGDDSCGPVTAVLLFRGGYEELDAAVATEAARGSDTISLTSATDLAVGDFVEVDGVRGQLPTYEYAEQGIAQDPSTGRDLRYPYDAGRITAVSNDSLTIDHPFSPYITEGSSLYRYREGNNNGVELLTVEGRSAEDTTYYRLISASEQINFRIADVTARWANRNFLDVSGHDITIVDFTGVEGGAVGFTPEACKYKVGIGPATDVTMVDSEIGSVSNDENMSLITTQFLYRAVFRNTTLGQSRTYGFNEHGGGSRDVVVENNWIQTGPSGWSGILLGNDTWGFGGETAVRNNGFADNVVDVLMVENPYGVIIAGNRSTGCVQACVTWSGWGGVVDGTAAIDDPDNYGSARLTIAGNSFESDGDGLDLGVDESNGFPWEGIRDVAVVDNRIDAPDGTALSIHGDASRSGRLWVTGNDLNGQLSLDTPGDDWWIWDNTGSDPDRQELFDDGRETQDLPVWAQLKQVWEHPGG